MRLARSLRPQRSVWQTLCRIVLSIVRQRGAPWSIALGAAIGMLVAFTPTMGFQMVLAVGLATLVGANRLAAIPPVWITNPLTMAPVFAFTYWLGNLFWPGPTVAEVFLRFDDVTRAIVRQESWDLWGRFQAVTALGMEVFMPMLIGGLIVGTLLGTITYFVVLGAVHRFQSRRRQRRFARQAERRLATPDRAAPSVPAALELRKSA